MKKRIGLILCMLCWMHVCRAQSFSVEYGPATIPIEQYFTISLKASPRQPVKVEGFPEIEGMQKSTQRRTSSTYRTGAKTTIVYTLTQQYAPLREGDFAIKPFVLQVDGKAVSVAGFKLKVGVQTPMQASNDSLPRPPTIQNTPEFVDVKENAFLTLHLPKEKVYVGEGTPVSLWFYVADSDLGLLDFYEFEPQILQIIRELKQRSVLEEVLEQGEIRPEKIKVGAKGFTRFKLYEAILFPITAQSLRLPAVSLRMIKYKIAKAPNLLSQNRLPEYKTYTTTAKTVEVRPLPPHPLRDQVAVGVFRLREQLSRNTISLNQNLVYQMQIEGEGNIGALPMPMNLGVPSEMEIYPPEIRENVTIEQGRVTGAKTFRYFIVGRQAGTYPLRELFQWVYFNSVTARYDTLRPAISVHVRGQEDANTVIREQDVGDFYSIIATESNRLIGLNQFKEVRLYTNIALAAMLVIALFIFIFKRNE